MINREQAREMAMQIRNECNRHGECTNNCPFFYSPVRWCIFDGQPYDWPVDDEKEDEQ